MISSALDGNIAGGSEIPCGLTQQGAREYPRARVVLESAVSRYWELTEVGKCVQLFLGTLEMMLLRYATMLRSWVLARVRFW